MTDKIWEFLTDNRLRLVIIHETQICEITHHCLITDKQKQTLKLLQSISLLSLNIPKDQSFLVTAPAVIRIMLHKQMVKWN